MKKWFVFVMCFVIIPLLWFSPSAQSQHGRQSQAGPAALQAEPAYPSMPGPGKKVPIGTEHYFIYGFDKKPKLGTVIMKVEFFTKDGKKETSIEAKADAGMPSMRGAHETGEQAFKLSKKGEYLLPINIVMPGDWEIRLTLSKEGKVLFKGSYQFNV